MFTDLNPDPDKIIYSHFTQATGALSLLSFLLSQLIVDISDARIYANNNSKSSLGLGVMR